MLTGIDVFVRVVETGGFTAAARHLGKSTSFVSKEVTRLENRLGARLLNRTTRSISLTETGSLYFEQCRQIVADATQAERSISESHATPHGVLKLSAPVSFGLGYLANVLPDFLHANPEVSLDIGFDDRMVDVIGEGFDLVLRVGHLRDSSLIAKQISSSRSVTVASPHYWNQFGRPDHPAELASHNCITYSLMHAPDRWEYSSPTGRPVTVNIKSRVRCNSAELECALALAGHGVTRLPEFACASELAQGTLESVLEDFAQPSLGIYAVYPHRHHLSAKVRAFIDFLAAKFSG